MQLQVLVDRAVIATADELFGGRHFASVVALCTEALAGEPGCVELLLLRARARVKLRRDRDAQADLRTIVTLAPECGTAYRMLGELAARRDENNTAAIFFREALRLQPGDREASEWLQLVEGARSGNGDRTPTESLHVQRLESDVRFARGTRPLDEEPTTPRGKIPIDQRSSALSAKAPAPKTDLGVSAYPMLPALPRKQPPRITAHVPLPEHPALADYLVESGIISRERLRAAQAYQRSMNVQLATAVVTLGLASPQRMEWAVVAHRAKLAGKL